MKKFVLFLLIAAVALAHADDSKLSPDLKTKAAPSSKVVVQYNVAPSLLDLKLLSSLGSILDSLPLVNGLVAELPLSSILSLSNQKNVKYISLDRALTPTLSNAAPAVN